MTPQRRLEIYAKQCNLIPPMLDNIGIRANVAFWSIGHKLTPKQRRRYLKKERYYPRNPPF